MSKDKFQLRHVEALCNIVTRLYPIKEDRIITNICEIAENALYKGGIEKWAKDNKYIPWDENRKRWDKGFGSVDQSLFLIHFCDAMKAEAKSTLKKQKSKL